MGLNDEEVLESRKKYGSNCIIAKEKNSFLHLVIESLSDPIIKILLIALGIKIIVMLKSFDWYETIGIVLAIVLASVISSISEYGSNKTFEHLQAQLNDYSTLVYRNNKLIEIKSGDVVVNDIIKVMGGSKIPADGIIIEGSISVDESFLSGEVNEKSKKINDNVYKETNVYRGSALIKVLNVGSNTYMGQISKEMEEKSSESPLKNKLRVFAKQISILGYFGAFLAAFSYLFVQIVVNNKYSLELIKITLNNGPLMLNYLIYSLTLMVTIIIMAVPEGLPMMITLVLSSNMNKMVKDKILIRKLVGIETSGSLNMLICDKTGTLTEGKLKVEKVLNYLSDANIEDNELLFKGLYLNNEAIKDDNKVMGGNISDQAILKYLGDLHYDDKIIERSSFDSEKKYAYVKTKEYFFIKGSWENILPKCQDYLLNKNKYRLDINYLKEKIKSFTDKGYRVIVSAYGNNLLELTFLGMVVLQDKIRNNAKDSLDLIKKAGINIIMITGDDLNTARSIGEKLSLLDNKKCINHDEFIKLSDKELMDKLDDIAIIARALPKDKSRLVEMAKKKNLVVGMTGDGVNDAPALKKSDVSFALGSGSEVSKDASDIILLDNNIHSIARTILYGRTIFKSIRKFIIYQLTVNICALLLSIIGVLIGVENPITIIQMLWLNMIMDTFAGIAFSNEAPLKEYMKEKPKRRDEKIMNSYMFNQILVNGLASFIICVIFLKVPFFSLLIRPDKKMTAFFALFIFLGIINSFLARTSANNLLENISLNKTFILINLFIIVVQIIIIYCGGNVFRTYGLSIRELLYVMFLSLIMIPIDYYRKKSLKKHQYIIGV